MAEQEIVKMSPKGQLVVPQNIRKLEKFKTGDRFVPVQVEGGVLFKKLEIPDVRLEFDRLVKELRGHVKRQNITRNDVSEAIKWARKG
ncbi:MAG: hypothetical protein AABW41_01645 [Nanoarchaeota archaeon]